MMVYAYNRFEGMGGLIPYFKARWPTMSATIAPTTLHQLPDDCWAISPGLLRSTMAPLLRRRHLARHDCHVPVYYWVLAPLWSSSQCTRRSSSAPVIFCPKS